MSNSTASPTESSMLTGRAMRWVYRTVPTLSSLVVAAASFALSFVALRDVAARTEAVPDSMAWLVPIVIDGGVMCASAVIWAAAAQRQKRPVFPFLVVFVLVVLSVVVNAAHAGPSLLAKVIAALPPLVLLATLELVALATRSTQYGPGAASHAVSGQQVDAASAAVLSPAHAAVHQHVVEQNAAVDPSAAEAAARQPRPAAKQPAKQTPRTSTKAAARTVPAVAVAPVVDPVLTDADLKDLEDLDRWAASAATSPAATSPVDVVAASARRPRMRALDPEEG